MVSGPVSLAFIRNCSVSMIPAPTSSLRILVRIAFIDGRSSPTVVRGGAYEGISNLGPSFRLPAESTYTIWSIVGSPAGIICSSSRSNRRESVLVIDCFHRFAATVVAARQAQSRALQ
jgi:hypothetical protein